MVSEVRSPAGLELHAFLRAQLGSGAMKAGRAIPSENELARQFGISRMTVRKVIDGFVESGALVRHRGSGTYVTEGGGEALRGATTHAVWLVMRASDETRGGMLNALLGALQGAGFEHTLIGTLGEDDAPRLDAPAEALIRRTERLPLAVLTESMARAETEAMRPFVAAGVPIVWLSGDDVPFGHGGHLATTDHERGAWLAAHHLVERGHTSITFLTVAHEAPFPFFHHAWRVQKGFMRGCAEAGVLDSCEQIDLEGDAGTWEEQVREILSGPERPTALFADEDLKATMVVKAAAQLGIRIPDELAVVGYGNTRWAEMFKITSVDVRVARIAEAAVQVLRVLEEGEPCGAVKVVVTPELAVRESSS